MGVGVGMENKVKWGLSDRYSCLGCFLGQALCHSGKRQDGVR